MVAGQKTAAPQACVKGLGLRIGDFAVEHHKGREIFAGVAESVAGPRAEAGATRLLVAGLEKCDGGVVVDGLGVHRANEAHIVGDFMMPRENVADLCATLAVGAEGGEGLCGGEGFLAGSHAGEALAFANRIGQVLAVEFFQRRFGVKKVDLRRRAALVHVNDAFGFGCKMWDVRQSGHEVRQGRFGEEVFVEQRSERGGADAGGGAVEEMAAGYIHG